MRHLTEEEREIINKMDKLDENSDEYKVLQKRLMAIDNEKFKDCPFVH